MPKAKITFNYKKKYDPLPKLTVVIQKHLETPVF